MAADKKKSNKKEQVKNANDQLGENKVGYFEDVNKGKGSSGGCGCGPCGSKWE